MRNEDSRPNQALEPSQGGIVDAPTYRLATLSAQPRLAVIDTGAECLRFSKQMAVVTYLAARPEARATRDELIGLLWGGSSPHDARQALRQVVYQIRRCTSSAFLTGDEALSLQPGACEFDVAEFREHLAAGRLQQALLVYQGDFLANVSLSGAREFEEWADGLRRQLAAERRQLLRTLVSREADAGRWAPAAGYAERLIAADPYDLEPRLRHIELLTLSGDLVRAAAAAEETRALAAATEGSRLSPSVELSIDRALQVGGAAERRQRDGFPRQPEIVGRATEFRRILDLWKRAQEGKGSGAVITGEPGIGKTRLVLELERRFQRDRCLIVRTACYAIEQSDPLSPFLDALRQAHSAPGLGGAAPASLDVLAAFVPEIAERFRASIRPRELPIAREALHAALVDGFVAIADQAPLALFVEDLHWAPLGAAEFAHRLSRAASTTGLLCIFTARDQGGPAGTPWLRDLTTGEAVAEVPLQPLDAADVEQMVASIAEIPPGDQTTRLLAWIMETSGGVPLYVLEGLKAAYDAGWLKVQQGRWIIRRDLTDLPQSASQVLRNRLSALGDPATGALVALAVSGRAIDLNALARIAALTAEQLGGALDALESRRLVGRAAGLPVIAHEEVAAAVLRETPKAAREFFHARACEVAEQEAAGGNPQAWPVAARHAAGAGEAARAALNAARAARAIEQMSGRRATPEAARTLLQGMREDVRPEVARLLQRVLDGSWSAGRWLAELSGAARRRRWVLGVAVAAAIALIAASTVMLAPLVVRASRSPNATLLVMTRAAAGPGERVLELPLKRDEWSDGAETLTPRPARLPAPVLAAARDQGDPRFSPQADAWVYSRVSADSGGLDLYLLRRGEAERRLTREPGDDVYANWAPDGRQLAFATSRWHPERRYDVGLLDLASGRVTRLTATDVNEGAISWSPDGPRILFVRRPLGDAADSLCWTTVDGSTNRCFSFPGYRRLGTTSWYDGHIVLLLADSAAHQMLLRVDLSTESPEVVDRFSGALSVSDDGHWAACLCTRGGYPTPALLLYPTDRPTLAKAARLPGEVIALPLPWTAPQSDPRYLARMEIPVPGGRIPLEATYRLSALGYDPTGQPVALPPVLRWHSGDTAVAAVDTRGVLRPRRTGTVTVHASAGGWRWDSARVTVEAIGSRTVLAEDWSANLERHWIGYGDPFPEVTLGPQGERAFWSHGDGEFASGAYSRQAFTARAGLGVEATLSTPITWNQWQHMVVRLTSALDSSELAAWDHRSGALPDRGAISGLGSCAFTAPESDAVRGSRRVALVARPPIQTTPASAQLQTGAWYRMRLQIFPDGTCGLALDNVPLARVQGDLPLAGRYRLVMEGQSVRTKILVGRLEVWEGIRGDVDWSVLDTSRSGK